MVERIERLGHAAGDCRFESPLGSSNNWKNLSVNPAVKGYLFHISEGEGSGRKGIGSPFDMLHP